MTENRLIRKLTVAIEAPLYLLIFPYFINFCLFASGFDTDTLIQLAVIGTLLSLVPLVLGITLRNRRLKRLLSYSKSSNIEEISNLKKGLLEHPRWEGNVILIRWSVSILGFSFMAVTVLGLPWGEIIALPYACVMLVPIIYLAFYFQSEVYLSAVLRDKTLANVSLDENKVRVFGVFQRNLYTVLAVAILPMLTFGYYLFLILATNFRSPYWFYQLPIVFVMMLVIMVYAAYVGSKSLKEDIGNLNHSIETLSKGELSESIPQLSATNLSHTIVKLNLFMDSLRVYFQTAKKEAVTLSDTSRTILNKGIEVDSQVVSEKNKIDSTFASVHQIQSLSKSTYERVHSQKVKTNFLANELTRVTQEMANLSKKAEELVINTNHSIGTVKVSGDAIQSAYEKVEQMNQMSENIKSAISIVEDISDRVNLLSLNASIEAARAGSMGRGFAVVASEVSRLADETAKNIEEIKRVVKLSQVTSKESLESMKEIISTNNDVKSKFEEISLVAQLFGKTSETSSENVKSLKDLVGEFQLDAEKITSEMELQTIYTETSNSNLQELWENHSQISTTFGEISEEANRLQLVSDSMEKIVSRFRF
ncbi:Methyl-accepting chemotaxis protein [Leptospira biflexa serovar Patoc strain 'Patoc 1 (Ames)']|uniref:Putative methyl-accepting chemotaxis protein (MCP) putative membrane protein n=1 Tax=Leptospira biflexa serovar Patoc (strain Patoc 1 / ATCC 23582 / Paris) TaxID=456481 RepID=B0SN11_LEPBP|nr:methyl-accepting chemotaxis protein [Leptospira biflexa]ABZ93566.1 Methyl-accepting chemotaxis protein [Leptospira biflexa serovar Patoc strain 'Patoc 1 (Ames)']ABZ97198.1 Putative methyl-accepting chemotaxis protein (MCP); putative membrane protein [Leptospira biflexa serovar Patoc strain 'Patoc 1 (Paris)']